MSSQAEVDCNTSREMTPNTLDFDITCKHQTGELLKFLFLFSPVSEGELTV